MKPTAYVIDLRAYDLRGNPSPDDYDYTAASEIYAELDRLNSCMKYHEATLAETNAGTLILTFDRNETTESRTALVWIESVLCAREIQRIADEYGFFELPRRPLMGEPVLNEMLRQYA